MQYHALSQGHHLCEPQSSHEKTAPEPRWRDILPNAPPVLFKGVMVIKNRKKHWKTRKKNRKIRDRRRLRRGITSPNMVGSWPSLHLNRYLELGLINLSCGSLISVNAPSGICHVEMFHRAKDYNLLVNITKKRQTPRYREQNSDYQWRGVEGQCRGKGLRGTDHQHKICYKGYKA